MKHKTPRSLRYRFTKIGNGKHFSWSRPVHISSITVWLIFVRNLWITLTSCVQLRINSNQNNFWELQVSYNKAVSKLKGSPHRNDIKISTELLYHETTQYKLTKEYIYVNVAIIFISLCIFHIIMPMVITQEQLVICLSHKLIEAETNGRHFADDTFKRIFLNENVRISIKISLKFVPKGPINNIPALVQIMAWRRPGDKPLSEPMVVSLPTHIYSRTGICYQEVVVGIKSCVQTSIISPWQFRTIIQSGIHKLH